MRKEGGQYKVEMSDEDVIALYEANGRVASILAPIWECTDGCARQRVRMAHKRLAMKANPILTTMPGGEESKERVLDQLERMNVDTTKGRVSRVDMVEWGVSAKVKNPDGSERLVKDDLYKVRTTIVPHMPAVEFVPIESKLVAYKPSPKNARNERIFIIGDQQIGYWAVLDDVDPQKIHFKPFHDERAQDVMLQALALYAPDRVVIIGDFFDFPQLSRFQQEPEWAQTMQASLQAGYDLLYKIRKTAPKAKIDFIPGNHETRMQRAIVNNNPALYNLRRPGEKYAIYSVPGLMFFEKLDIEPAAEFPSGKVVLAPRVGNRPALIATHAPKSKTTQADTIHGHEVLPGLTARQVFFDDHVETIWQMCVSGCGNYSNTGDKVRLTRTNTPSGRDDMAFLQTFGTVDIDRETGHRIRAIHHIEDGSAQFLGKILTAREAA